MTDDEARAWLRTSTSPDRVNKLEAYVDALLIENRSQNLISKTSEATVWARHIVDSAQLARLVPADRSWLDIGSGAGLPGIVLAILSDAPILLTEPRRRRADFLRAQVEALSLSHASVFQSEVEKLRPQTFGAVTARAFAPLGSIFLSTIRFTDASTIWVLPKGQSVQTELAAAEEAWQGVFHVEHSLTDEHARIVVASGVRPR